MKFRVTTRDLVIFIMFCIFLFYLACIAVLNFSSLGNQGYFAGLNPFPAFTARYFAATIITFAIFLIVIFTSVASYIFDKEKGKGWGIFTGEKEEKGYSRWSKDKEIKNDKDVEHVLVKDRTTNAAGIALINNGTDIWVDNGEYHNLVIGATGSGKSESVVKPMVNVLAKKGESMIITDPKGELYKYSAGELASRGYKIIVLNFRDPQNGNAWNPLSLPYHLYKEHNTDKATELLDDVALNILYDPNNKGEPFWEKSAADYFSGLALGLFEDASERQVNLNSINYMSTVGEDRMGPSSNYIKEYFTLKGEESSPYVFASNTINAPAETKGGILSVFRQKIRLFASRENLSEMLAYSDFDMRDIGREKTAVFILIHDEKTTYHSLATIFIKQCYESLIDVAQENGGKLKIRTNFILDEFANMPPLKDVTTMVTAARSRDIRFTFIIQNFAQIKDVYGDKNAETIKGNCGNLIYLISTELSALEEISKMCGEVKSKEKDKTASTPLVTVTDLQKLKLFEAIIIRWRLSPFKTYLEPAFKIDWGLNGEAKSLPVRERKEVELFDIKEYVKQKKKNNLFNAIDNKGMPTGNPMGGMNPNPFNPMAGDMGMNPFAALGVNPNKPGKDLDMDDFIKKIDAKIAELEAEEAAEKKKAEQGALPPSSIPVPPKPVAPLSAINAPGPAPAIQPQLDNSPKPVVEQPIVKAEPVANVVPPMEKIDDMELPKPKVVVDKDAKIINESIVSDDQYFDDFFGDDD